MTLRYRLLRSLFATSEHWKLFDPYFAQKLHTYKASGTAVHRMNTLPLPPCDRLADRQRIELAVTLAELEAEKHIIANDPEKLKVLFHEMTQMCLWCVYSPVTRQKSPESIAPGETPQ